MTLQQYRDSHDPCFHRINADYPGLQVVHAEPWVFLVHDLFTDAECEDLILGVSSRLVPTRTSGGLRPDRRRSRSARCWSAALQQKIATLVNLPTRHLEGLKVTNYQQGEYFKPHHDAFRGAHDETTGQSLWPCVPGDYPNRVVSLIGYLNDVPQGGSTYFPRLGLDVRPKKGMGLLFAPAYTATSPAHPGKQDTRLIHEGRAAVSEKWICTQWGWSCEYIPDLDPVSGF